MVAINFPRRISHRAHVGDDLLNTIDGGPVNNNCYEINESLNERNFLCIIIAEYSCIEKSLREKSPYLAIRNRASNMELTIRTKVNSFPGNSCPRPRRKLHRSGNINSDLRHYCALPPDFFAGCNSPGRVSVRNKVALSSNGEERHSRPLNNTIGTAGAHRCT